MPFHLNKVMLSGTMTKEAEIKYTPSGTAIANVSLAINRVYFKGEGNNKEKVEETTYVEVEAWGRTAEIFQEHTGKGHTVYIEGRLKLDQWEDKETQKKRSKLRIVCEEFKFVSSPRSESGGGHEYEEKKPPSRPQQKAKPPADPDLDTPAEDDIPFMSLLDIASLLGGWLMGHAKALLQVRKNQIHRGVLQTSPDGGWSTR